MITAPQRQAVTLLLVRRWSDGEIVAVTAYTLGLRSGKVLRVASMPQEAP